MCSLQPCSHLVGKGRPLGSFVSFVMFLCAVFFFTFLYGVRGQEWYLIVWIRDKVGRSKPGANLTSVLTGDNRPSQYFRSDQHWSIGGHLKN